MVFPAGPKEKEAKEAADDTVTSCESYGKNFYALPNTGVCVAAGGQAELTGTASRLSNGLQQNQLVFHGALQLTSARKQASVNCAALRAPATIPIVIAGRPIIFSFR